MENCPYLSMLVHTSTSDHAPMGKGSSPPPESRNASLVFIMTRKGLESALLFAIVYSSGMG
jgi:hypothetical protein